MVIVYILALYLLFNIFGVIIKKIRIPRIYAALFLGVLLSESHFIQQFKETDPVKFLSTLGMVTLLFLLGYGINLKKVKEKEKLVVRITAFIILAESIVGITILHFFFGTGWILSFVIAISFATIGEIALLPILKEFKLINTNLGQTILGVAVLDDIVELTAFILLFTLVSGFNLSDIAGELIPISAIAIGAFVGNTIKDKEKFQKKLEFVALFVFGPMFFFTAGTEAHLSILVRNFGIILAITLVIKVTKIYAAYLAAHKELGTKKAIVLGVSTGIKFSSSIIILILLLDNGLIDDYLFSILIGIKVLFKFIVPILLTYLLTKWDLELKED